MNRKVGLIVLAVVVALGALGVGYAAWSQTLTINGNVSTGTYDVVFANLSATETDTLGVGNVTADNLAGDGHSFDVTVTNGYPGYVGVAHFDVHNTSSVPAKVTVTVSDVDADYTAVVNGITTGDVIAAGATKTPCDVTITIADGAGSGNLNQTFTITIVADQGV